MPTTALDTYGFAERAGPDYRPGNPVLFAFHGPDGDENGFLDLAGPLFPEAIVIAPRGDVSEDGMRRFFHGAGESDGDLDDRAARTRAMADFLAAHVERLKPSRVVGLGYSGGADILAGAVLQAPGLFAHVVLMHPFVPGPIGDGDALAGRDILITAGGRDPLCPPEATGQLADGLEGRGAKVRVVWHPGGHEMAQGEIDAAGEFFAGIRAGLVDVRSLPVEREQDESGKGRYVIHGAAGAVAEMIYTLTGPDQIIIDHTEVPDAFRGTGTAMRLLQALMADAENEGRKIIPICPYAAAQFDKHPEWADRLAYRVRTKSG